uniref:cytochrome P450 2U1-like n=1 Tax=Styela clava TaxID=7725 RepID=UPI00193A58AD|nr:cytochrome P450 2U1-like [Styela clava]
MSWTVSFDYFTSFVCISTFIFCFYMMKRPKRFPPGPYGLPIVGYIPFIGKNPAATLWQMKEKYGSVMSVQMGQDDWVILNDFDIINEALVKQADKFSGRPENYVFDLITTGRGLASRDYGSIWKELHKFGLMTLRGFGVGKKGMEANIIEETPFLIESLTTNNEKRLHAKLFLAVSNIISRVILGSRFEYDDKKFIHMMEIVQKYAEITTHSKLLTALSLAPMLRFIPPFKGVAKITKEDSDSMLGYLREIVEKHESNFEENDIHDFIDAFLVEIEKSNKNDKTFNKQMLIQYIRDLLDAGSETTSTTLGWALLCFGNYPECQERISDEVMKTLGEDGLPSMKHQDEMPYTCAFIHELMRHRTLAPLSVYHKTNEEATLDGYTIPKNTTVAPNLWAVHFDPKHFANPEEFRPERFLDRDGKFIKSNYVIPFSIGPRSCIGKQLAKMEIFIFLTAIVQKLKVLPNPKKPLPSFNDGGFSLLSYQPQNFEVIFERR